MPVTLIASMPRHQTKQKQPKNTVTAAKGDVAVTGAKPGNGNHVAKFEQASFSGPMPPPAVLEGYERVIPGAAERILLMAESDTRHQQEIEFAALMAAEGEVKRGQWFAFSIGVLALISSMVALHLGSPAVAGVIGGTTVVGLVSVFVVGRFVKQKD